LFDENPIRNPSAMKVFDKMFMRMGMELWNAKLQNRLYN